MYICGVIDHRCDSWGDAKLPSISSLYMILESGSFMLYSSNVCSCPGTFGFEERCGRPKLQVGSKYMAVESIIDSMLVANGSSDEYQ